FFGAIERFRDAMRRVEKTPKALIIRMRNVVAIDASGLQTMDELLESCKKKHVSLLLSAVGPQPLSAMKQSGFIARLGEENVLGNIYDALDRARTLLDVEGSPPE